jgi:hypothetical protein
MKYWLPLLLIFSTKIYSEDKFQATQAKAVMGSVYESFVKIIPYVYADKANYEALNVKKNQDELISNLTEISNLFKGAKHVEFFQKPGFKPSLDTINTHLEDTILSLQSHNFVFAQSRLKAVTALCVSCHSQLSDSMAKNAFGEAIGKEKRSRFESDYAFANYLYLVRRFTEAVNYFELSINTHLEKSQTSSNSKVFDDNSSNQEIMGAIRRVLSIYTKINLNPEKAISFLKKYQGKKNISKFNKATMAAWLKSLESWKSYDSSKPVMIEEYIAKYLEPIENKKEKSMTEEGDITLLISSGVLTKYLSENPKTSLTPAILYWLSLAERRLSNTYFFSLSDLYLKDCITLYPKSDYAKKCFREYEENLTFGYSGSSGTDIPEGEKRELEKLRKLIK